MALALSCIVVRAGDDCNFRYLGSAGDTVFIGWDRYPRDPNYTQVPITRIDVVVKDSIDSAGNRYWWYGDIDNDWYIVQAVDGVVGTYRNGAKLFETIGLCDTIGQVRRIGVYELKYLGEQVIYLMKKPTLARTYFRWFRNSLDSLIPQAFDYYVEYLGQVLVVSADHGSESERVVGAVLSGVRYGGNPTSVIDGPSTRKPTWDVSYGQLRLRCQPMEELEVLVTDLTGRVAFDRMVQGNGVVDVSGLSSGAYIICVKNLTTSSVSCSLTLLTQDL
ncbi:MAG: T9SS type A sorting domain-containing protein [Ignavibacteria bacterium]|nr:T9SS type A sorting domain-containing protein [Ignavibacteria bacterium]